jgi:hypothetical protein
VDSARTLERTTHRQSRTHDRDARLDSAADGLTGRVDALRPAEVQLRAWEETLKGLMILLEQSWDALRHAARYAHDNDAIHVDLDGLASAYALSRRG